MSETINRVDQFYTGDFAQIMTGVYIIANIGKKLPMKAKTDW